MTPFTLTPWFALPEWTEQFCCPVCGREPVPGGDGWLWDGEGWCHYCPERHFYCQEVIPKTRW